MNSSLFYTKHSIFLSLLICVSIFTFGQLCTPVQDSNCLPKMWKSKYEGSDMVKDFISKKLPDIERRSTVKQFARIELGNFIGMIEYFEKSFPNYKTLRVYIGEYSSGVIPNVPTRFAKQLTLIFSPSDANGRDLNSQIFFVIPPGSSFDDVNNLSNFQIDKNTKDAWVSNYSSVMTLNGIDLTNQMNICQNCTIKTPTDTWSVLYQGDFVHQLITELGYCHRDATNSRDISLTSNFVASFAVQDYFPKPPSQPNYRTIILFDFADANFNPIFLDDMFDFPKRSQCQKVGAIDNGQLCPTVCN